MGDPSLRAKHTPLDLRDQCHLVLGCHCQCQTKNVLVLPSKGKEPRATGMHSKRHIPMMQVLWGQQAGETPCRLEGQGCTGFCSFHAVLLLLLQPGVGGTLQTSPRGTALSPSECFGRQASSVTQGHSHLGGALNTVCLGGSTSNLVGAGPWWVFNLPPFPHP